MMFSLKIAAAPLLSAVLLLADVTAAHAQDIGPVFDMGALTNTLAIPTAAGKAGSRPSARPTKVASFSYVPTADLKARTVRGYVDRLKTTNPAASQAIATTFGPGKNDYGQVYRGLIQDGGLHDNDAADAMAGYLVLGWMVVNNVQDGKAVTPAMERGVRGQVAQQMAKSPKLTTPGVPAQLGEEMKLQCVIVQGGWQSAIKENSLAAYQQGIAAMFKNQYGMDFALVKLTPQGFAKK